MKKIVFITTVNHNVGDDFVREGLKYLFRQKFSNEVIEFENIHKHSPITCRHGYEWFRNYRLSSKIDYLLPLSLTRDRILESDIVVQSGAPVYWCHDALNSHCANNEWYQPLILRRFTKNKKAKLLNLAAGTCQNYHSDGTEFLKCVKDVEYIRKLFKISAVTTLRDSLARTVLNLLGLDSPVIPCSSIFAADEHRLKSEGNDYVAVNYMDGGSHYTFGQNIDKGKWNSEFQSFYWKIKKMSRVVFICHNKQEVYEAKRFDPAAEIFYSDDFIAYMKFYSRARFGILNRVHGAFMLASFGKPSIVIGNDTRAKMANEIALRSYFVNDVDCQLLIKEYERLEEESGTYGDRFYAIKRKAFTDYLNALRVLL